MRSSSLLALVVDQGADMGRGLLALVRTAAGVDFNLPGSPDPFNPLDLPGALPPLIPGQYPPGDHSGDGSGGDGTGGDGPYGPPGPTEEPPPDPDDCEE